MLKFILIFIAVWLAVRFVRRLVRMTFFFSRNGRPSNRASSFSSPRRREQVEEAEFEVIDSHIKQDE
jgi:hypothetical protein